VEGHVPLSPPWASPMIRTIVGHFRPFLLSQSVVRTDKGLLLVDCVDRSMILRWGGELIGNQRSSLQISFAGTTWRSTIIIATQIRLCVQETLVLLSSNHWMPNGMAMPNTRGATLYNDSLTTLFADDRHHLPSYKLAVWRGLNQCRLPHILSRTASRCWRA